jgi:hypothetical protein
MNLDDGSALTAVSDAPPRRQRALRRRQLQAPRRSGARLRTVGVSFSALRRWTSPASKATYPVEWAIETPVGR